MDKNVPELGAFPLSTEDIRNLIEFHRNTKLRGWHEREMQLGIPDETMMEFLSVKAHSKTSVTVHIPNHATIRRLLRENTHVRLRVPIFDRSRLERFLPDYIDYRPETTIPVKMFGRGGNIQLNFIAMSGMVYFADEHLLFCQRVLSRSIVKIIEASSKI